MNKACIGIGSNDDAEARIACGLTALDKIVTDITLSQAYWSPDIRDPGAPEYLNLALSCTTTLALDELRAALKCIETACGRDRAHAHGVVALDLDLLLLETAGGDWHQLAWPALADAAHVLAPLAELRPHWCHPQAGRTLAALWAECDTSKVPLRRSASVWPQAVSATLEKAL